MSKKIYLALILSLMSSNSLYAMDGDEAEEGRSNTGISAQVKEDPEEECGSPEMFADTVTVKITDGFWAHVKPTHNAVRAKAEAWVTRDADEYSLRVPVQSIRLDLDIGGRPRSHTEFNTSTINLDFKGSSPFNATAQAWFTNNPHFATFGPVVGKAR